MSLANFYDNSSHVDAAPPSADSAKQQQQANADALKATTQAAEHKAATLFDSMPQGERKPVEPTKVEPDKAATLYNAASTYVDSVLVTEVPAGKTQEDVAAANASYHAELAKLELPGVMVREVTDRFTAAMRAPISDAEYDRKVASFTTDLAPRFGGAEHVAERLADVQKLLAKADPAVIDALVESGLNVDVDTIVALANHARSLKGRGRL